MATSPPVPPASGKPAAGETPARSSNPYTRFIPREELGSFASWKLGAIEEAQGQDVSSMRVERRAEPRPADAPLPTPDEWRAKIQAARQQGYQDGYRDGLVALEGFKQSFAAQVTQQIGQLVSAFDAELQGLEGEMAQQLSATAVALAERVLRQELQQRPDWVVGLARQAVDSVMLSARQILVHVHPDDVPLVQQGAGDVLQRRGARLVADATIHRGGCTVESDAGAVDATIDRRWADASAALGHPSGWASNAQGQRMAAPTSGPGAPGIQITPDVGLSFNAGDAAPRGGER